MGSSSDTELSYLPDSVSEFSSDGMDVQREPSRKHGLTDAEQLATAVGRVIGKQLDTTEHGPVMLNREGRERAIEKEKYERRLQEAITMERYELLNKGHVKAPISSADPAEVRLVRVAFAGVRQFIDAIAGYRAELRERRAHERKTIDWLQKQQEELRGTERTRWRTLPEENLLDEFIRTAETE